VLFENSQDLSVPALKVYATKIGLKDDQFNACLESGKYAGEIQKEITDGTEAGVDGTPTFVIGLTGSGERIIGTMVSGAQPMAKFKQIIDDVLKVAEADKSKPEKRSRGKSISTTGTF